MRKTLLFLLVALVSVAGCSNSAEPDFFTTAKPKMTVMLTVGSSQAERNAVNTAILALPGVQGVTFVSQAEEYAKIASGAPDLAKTIKPEDLPPSIQFTTTDLALYNKIRNGSFPADVKRMPGVADIVIACATLDECKRQYSSPAPSPR